LIDSQLKNILFVQGQFLSLALLSTGFLMKGKSKRVLLSWSTGKDSAWALHSLRQQFDVEVAGLLTTVNEQFDRVAMHAVRTDLLRRQAESVGLSLRLISLPSQCDNGVYEERMRAAIGAARADGIESIAFGVPLPFAQPFTLSHTILYAMRISVSLPSHRIAV